MYARWLTSRTYFHLQVCENTHTYTHISTCGATNYKELSKCGVGLGVGGLQPLERGPCWGRRTVTTCFIASWWTPATTGEGKSKRSKPDKRLTSERGSERERGTVGTNVCVCVCQVTFLQTGCQMRPCVQMQIAHMYSAVAWNKIFA